MDKEKILKMFEETQAHQHELFVAGLAAMGAPEPERPSPTTLPTPPKGPVFIDRMVMKTRGNFPNNYPEGAIVHFTSGHFEKGARSAIDSVDYGKDQGYAYWCIATDGTIVKGHALSEWGYHAGVSSYPGLGDSVSRKLLGVEMCNAGKLTLEADGSFTTWFKTKIPVDQVRFIDKPRYPSEEVGYYHAYTSEQYNALVELLLWLKANSKGIFSFDKVLGHSEVAQPIGRKNDPGGALPDSMPLFRQLLKGEAMARGIK